MKFLVLLCLAAMALASPHNKIHEPRIAGSGSLKVPSGEAKFMAGVEIGGLLGLNGYRFKCGGIIFNENTILTAASCVEKLELLSLVRVRVGSLRREEGGSTFLVRKIIIHPNNNEDGPNNLAILKLYSSITIDSQTSSISLYPQDNVGDLDDKDVTVAGWANSNGDLLKIGLRVHAWGWCANYYAGQFNFDNNMFCAGGSGRGSCEQDVGGPVYVNDGGADELVGLVAFGYPCYGGGTIFPMTYLNLPRYKNWIVANSAN